MSVKLLQKQGPQVYRPMSLYRVALAVELQGLLEAALASVVKEKTRAKSTRRKRGKSSILYGRKKKTQSRVKLSQ
jgi:hypothetical protein